MSDDEARFALLSQPAARRARAAGHLPRDASPAENMPSLIHHCHLADELETST